MRITELDHLEVVSEETNIVGSISLVLIAASALALADAVATAIGPISASGTYT